MESFLNLYVTFKIYDHENYICSTALHKCWFKGVFRLIQVKLDTTTFLTYFNITYMFGLSVFYLHKHVYFLFSISYVICSIFQTIILPLMLGHILLYLLFKTEKLF